MKQIKWTILIFFMVIGISRPTWAVDVVRLTNGEWPPYLSENLKHYGLFSKIVEEAFATEGVKVEYGFFPWKRARKLAQDGRWDGSIAWIFTKERTEFFIYSDPIGATESVFFHLKSNSFDWKTMDDLEKYSIGVVAGYGYTSSFVEKRKTGTLLIEEVPNELFNFKKLLNKRIDVFIATADVGYYLLNLNYSPEVIETITYHPKILDKEALHLILSKKNLQRSQEIVKIFNKGIKRLRESGQYDKFFEESRQGKYLK